MHKQELYYLDSLARGKANKKNLGEMFLSTPYILDCVKHGDAELIDILFKNYMNIEAGGSLLRYKAAADFYCASEGHPPWDLTTQLQLLKDLKPNQSKARDVYWHLLFSIDLEARQNNARDVMSWLLDQYSDPAFPYFTPKDQTSRYNARSNKFVRNRNEHPLPRRDKDAVYSDVEDIFTWAIKNGDRALMHKAINVMQNDFKYHHRENSKYIKSGCMRVPTGSLDAPDEDDDLFLGLENALLLDADEETSEAYVGHVDLACMRVATGKIDEPKDTHDVVAYVQRTMAMLDEADTLLGSEGSAKAYIHGKLVAGLAHEDAEVRGFFRAQTSMFTEADKELLFRDHNYMTLERGDDDHNFRAGHVFNHRSPHVLREVLSLIDEWDRALETPKYREMFFEDVKRSYHSRYAEESGLLDNFAIENHFDSVLTWAEVEKRLTLLQQETPDQIKPISLDESNYFSAALSRALEFGHIDDLRDLIEYAREKDKTLDEDADKVENRKASYVRKIARNSSFQRISRIPEIIEVFNELLDQRDFWGDDEEDQNRNIRRLLERLAEIPHSRERQHDARCSFYKDGLPIDKEDYTNSIPPLMDMLERELSSLSDEEERKYLLKQFFGEDGDRDYFGLAETLRTIKHTRNLDALLAVTNTWFEVARPYYGTEKQDKLMGKLSEVALYEWKSTDDMARIDAFVSAVEKHDKNGAREVINQSDNRFVFSAEDYYRPLRILHAYPEIMSDEEKAELDTPVIDMLMKRFDTFDKNREEWTKAGLEIPHPEALQYPPTNFDPEFYAQLVEPMKRYSEMERNNNAEYHAYKLATLFPNISKASRYLHNHAQGTEAVHDACLFSLPLEGDWDKELWANLAMRWGNGALRWLSYAPQLETVVAQLNEGKEHKDILRLSECKPADLRALVHEHCGFKNKHLNPELAETLLDNGVAEKYFDETFAFIQEYEAKHPDVKKRYIPELNIDGTEIGHDGYVLETLPQGDYRNLWMGQFVNCCMHLGNQGRNLAIAMFKEPFAAAYVIKNQQDDIVAAMHSWLSKDGNMVFNSWQPKTSDHNFLRDSFIKAAADQAIEKAPKVNRVVMGQGAIDEDELPYTLLEGRGMFASEDQDYGEVNVNDNHYTADTQKGQFVLADRRQKTLALQSI